MSQLEKQIQTLKQLQREKEKIQQKIRKLESRLMKMLDN
jgi:uncharacterized protein YigA (DUF484 family)